MIITPLDAREPYIAVADASFKTVKDSISLGLILAKIPLEPPTPSFVIGNPSITIKGLLEALIEDPPLILISDPDPGAPLVVTVTPATRPCNKFSAVTILPFVKSLAVTDSIDPVASFLVIVP